MYAIALLMTDAVIAPHTVGFQVQSHCLLAEC